MSAADGVVGLFSDSLSALQAIKHNSQSSREDVVKEIVVVCHQLITRGTDIVLQWVPSHVGVPGNESADRAAKQVARGLGATALHLTLSFTDIKTLLTRAVWKLCGEEFAAKARDSGYTNDLSPPTGTACVSPRCQCTSLQVCTVCVVTCGEPSSSPNCLCGQMVSPYHAIFKCPAMAGHFKPIIDKLRLLNLPPDLSSLRPSPRANPIVRFLLFLFFSASYCVIIVCFFPLSRCGGECYSLVSLCILIAVRGVCLRGECCSVCLFFLSFFFLLVAMRGVCPCGECCSLFLFSLWSLCEVSSRAASAIVIFSFCFSERPRPRDKFS